MSCDGPLVKNAVKDEGEWITTENIEGFLDKGNEPVIDKVSVACQTEDQAMQNVLLRMRLHLHSSKNVRVKNWLLRCHACYECTKIMDRKFCPKCGGATLLRTSYIIDEQGEMHLFLKSNFQYNVRGNIYSIPMPKGGRQGSGLFLREDQPEYQKALRSFKHQENKMQKNYCMDAIDDRLACVFGGMNIKVGRGSFEGDSLNAPAIGYGRRNPNQARRKKK